MIKSERTKRRKIKSELNYIFQSTTNSDLESQDNEMAICSNFREDNIPTIFNEINRSYEISKNTSSATTSDSAINKSEQFTFVPNEIHCSDVNNCKSSFSIRQFLTNWATEYNISHVALNGLLKGLKTHECFNDLPVSSKTLLCTPKNTSSDIRHVKPGIYYHFGLAAGIHRYISNNATDIKIAIGIDGLPLSKSSNSQFWPILAYIIDDYFPKKVFLVGIFHGYDKPSDSNDFLFDFINEAKELLNNGIIINQKYISVSIHVFCCDAPAKSFILKIKGHTGFSSCTRCTIEGEYLNNRVCFPYSQLKSTERNHQSYINQLDEEHHSSNQTLTRLIELRGFDCVKSFSLDYMHLVCLGVVKKLLLLWVKGPLYVRLRFKKINELSTNLLNLKKFISSDFVRNVRGIQDIGRWKATEFRLFLLYLGPIVLKNILKSDCYIHFMTLNISMLILLSPDRGYLFNYAKKLLDYFVKQFQVIYGKHYVSHNIHGLLHITDDYELYGPLDNCSTFYFENYMKELKSMLRKHEKPLHQIIHRYSEKHNVASKVINNLSNNKNQNANKLLLKEHTNGPLMNNITGPQYYVISFNNFNIKIKYDKR